MKIAIFSDHFYPEFYGITDSIIKISKELIKRGHSIIVFAPKYIKKNYKLVNLQYKELDFGKNFKVIRFSSFPFPSRTGQGRFVFPLGRAIYYFKKHKPDIIHTHLPFGTCFEGLFAAKLLNIPMVGTNHASITGLFKNKIFKKIALIYNNWFYRNCKFISSPSEITFNEANKSYSDIPHKVISNPIDTNEYKKNKNEKNIKKEFGLSDFTVLYIGRIAAEKNINLIIEAVAKIVNKIPNINLVIAGKGNLEYKLKKLAESLGIERNVKFMGFLSSKREVKIYNASDVFVIMSGTETQCISAMKAMACKVPVISSKAIGIEKYVNNKSGFLINIGDVNALAEKLIFLYKNPKKRINMGIKGKKYIQQFKSSNIADTWEEIYKKVIEDFKK